MTPEIAFGMTMFGGLVIFFFVVLVAAILHDDGDKPE
jgi:hypothetical protein